jgi:7-cyano-7-deazaguanine synthase
MWLDKAAALRLAAALGGEVLVNLVREETHTCYLGDRTHRHAWGYGCGGCLTCDFRRNGWAEYAGAAGQVSTTEVARV